LGAIEEHPDVKPGERKLPQLFRPGRIGRFATKNMIKYGACCVSNYNTRDGFVSERELARTKVIAGTGCGIITNQGAYPDPLGEGKAYFRQIAIYDDKFLPQFEKIAGYIHDAGAVAIQQILHAGRYGGIDLGYCLQPSLVPQTLPHFRPPREITVEQIGEVVRQHADAARRAVKAGFDGTEITSFMGYLLATFNSRFTNQRTDAYGGSIESRGRFMRELIDAIKQATPEHPLIVRLNGAELMDRWGGNTEDECFELMAQAVDSGVDMISVTVGWQEAPESSIGRDIPPGHWNYLAARAKKMFPQTPIAFGNRLPDPVMANECIGNGEFDFWEVCRPLLADPELVHKAAEDRLDEVRRCVGSLNCLSRLFRDLPYTCTMNPALGHEVEPEYQVKPAAVKKKIMVIGAGPAGLECAITAAKRGHDVVIFEKAAQIGGNLVAYAANDLARRDDLDSIVRHYDTMTKKLGVDVRLGVEATPKFMRSVLHQFDAAVVAAGARIDRERLASIEGAERIVDGIEVAHGRVRAGRTVVVIGAGKIGLAVAEKLASGGAQVTIVEADKRIAGDVMPSFKWRHSTWVDELGIATLTQSRVTRVTADAVFVATVNGDERVIAAETVIAATPRAPNQQLFHELEWMIDELHGCGDALVPRGLDAAIHEGFRLGVRL
jgi:2,4-dienoyl-CoA reductase (NADPH2)